MRRFKLGRKPRLHLASVPHFSSLIAGQTLPLPPPSVDYTQVLAGAPLGMMMNGPDSDNPPNATDGLGDCTCAAFGHAVQVWSANAGGSMTTLPDSDILSLYEGACGYQLGNESTDQGGDEQTVLGYLVNTGCGGNKLAAFVEIDPRNTDDVKRAIAACGLVYIGFNVPDYLPEAPNSDWDVQPGSYNIEGGHAVILAGYDAARLQVISWGEYYSMTWAFFGQFVDEVYALADQSWLESTGKTLGGLTLADLEQQMQAIKQAA